MEPAAPTTTDERFRLAMHETIELRELMSTQVTRLLHDKRAMAKITDPQLRALYLQCIHTTTAQIHDLARCLQYRPTRRG